MCTKSETIEIKLPFKAEFVSVARLTASGIANRMGFDIETVEDIKVAISEVCNKLVYCGIEQSSDYKVIFRIEKERLVIIFHSDDKDLRCTFNEEDDMLGVSIIKALMDEVELCASGEHLFYMAKAIRHEFKRDN